MWLAQVLVLLLALVGAVMLARSGRWLEAVMLSLPIVYVTGVHLPLLCEARQSLPVKPVVLALAAIALTRSFRSGTVRLARRTCYFPAKRSFMNSSISDTHTRPSAPF